MRRWGITLGFVVLCGVLLAIFAMGFGRDPHEVPFMLRGKAAPEFTLRSIDGQKISLSAYKGKPVVINFWATWCGPCRSEEASLRWGARQFGDKAQFLGMIFEDTEDAARSYLAESGMSYPQLIDPESRTAVDYGTSGVPETYFISADGKIADKYVGPIPPTVLAERINKLLGLKTVQQEPQR